MLTPMRIVSGAAGLQTWRDAQAAVRPELASPDQRAVLGDMQERGGPGMFCPRQIIETYSRRYNARDLAGLSALYDPCARVIAPWRERVEKTWGVKLMLNTLLKLGGVMHAAQAVCLSSDDTALNEGHWVLKGGVDCEGQKFHAVVRTYQVLRKHGNGRWRIVIEDAACVSTTRD